MPNDPKDEEPKFPEPQGAHGRIHEERKDAPDVPWQDTPATPWNKEK